MKRWLWMLLVAAALSLPAVAARPAEAHWRCYRPYVGYRVYYRPYVVRPYVYYYPGPVVTYGYFGPRFYYYWGW
ncbi:MAG: hypothetical protein K6T86_20840 [Pirellulales bacterium]|jgi:hypothetical protein|nr:hypothetical protein [Pirellulales bacterium]